MLSAHFQEKSRRQQIALGQTTMSCSSCILGSSVFLGRAGLGRTQLHEQTLAKACDPILDKQFLIRAPALVERGYRKVIFDLIRIPNGFQVK